MKKFLVYKLPFLGVLFFIQISLADEIKEDIHAVEEVLVFGLPLKQSKTDSALPITVLEGDNLREAASATLGETLAREPGLRSASFGGGVGRPVIRGQSSTRIRVLQNGSGVLDASAVSPDHSNAVEPLIAKQIEVIRGPATLLYGNGAIGGVINVVDNRIPQETTEDTQVTAEYKHNSVNDGSTFVSTVDAKSEKVFYHADLTLRDSNNVSIPGYSSVDKDDHENTFGYIGNSQQQSSDLAAGLSWAKEKSFWGFSVSHLQNDYGIPSGIHEHHEGEADDEGINLEVTRTRFEFKGEKKNIAFADEFMIKGNFTDYEHRELEGSDEVATRFNKKGYELRSSLLFEKVNKTVVGVQIVNNVFTSVGEEAYLPRVEQSSSGVYALHNIDVGLWSFETGLRYEYDNLDLLGCSHKSNSWSASAASIYALTEESQLVASYARSQRAPAMEELYSNIDAQSCLASPTPLTHFATGLVEIGDPTLADEVSGNLEFSLRKNIGDIRGELSVYENRVDDYIYLDIIKGESGYFIQGDARFVGVEGAFTLPLFKWQDSHVDLTLAGDVLEAKLDAGNQYLPRIPPSRVSVELAWWSQNLHTKLYVARNSKQDKVSALETATEAYTRVDVFSEYHWYSGAIFLKVNNLLNEEIRNHTSYIKDKVPEPGRGVELGARIFF